MPTCLVTGASRGIGLEFVKQYAADGWSVIATCRRPDQVQALSQVQGDVRIEELDVSDFARIEALARRLDRQPIDLLLNNAAIYGPRITPHDGVDYAAWAEVMRVNAMAPLKLTAVLVPNLARSDLRTAIGISSLMGSIGDNASGGAYIYRSAKAALHAVMRSLSVDLRPKRILVCVLNPGWVRTDMGGSAAPLDPFESVAGMRDVISRLTMRDSGRFFNYDGGELPW
ncbi:MAG TPA: SDR family oxidoreductase [Rhodospirillales bacterium]|nr:SDR family oxidoreductase [Rhodospirillales bacterium]